MDNQRTRQVKKNIVASFAIKGCNALIQLLIVPLSLQCLTKYEYGLWLTINSIIIGFDSIDVGLGNGLRNRLAEFVAKGDMLMARKQVSTTFIMLIAIIAPLILLFCVAVSLTDCYSLLNVDQTLVPNLDTLLMASFAIMGATFVFKFIGNVYQGLQMQYVNNMLVVMGQGLSLLVIGALYLCGWSTLLSVVCAFTLSPLVVYLVAYPITFASKYPHLSPSIATFHKASVKPLVSLGFLFFIIQISGLLLFMSSNVIISRVFTPEMVTPYQISYRYFSLLFMLFSIVIAPLWSAITDAYTKRDWEWIRYIIRKQQLLLAACLAIDVVMLILAPYFYDIWTGGKVTVDFMLSLLMAIYIYMMLVSNAFSNMIFGIGKIKLIALVTFIEMILFVPIEYLACQQWGYIGLISTLIAAMVLTAFINMLQLRKILSNAVQTPPQSPSPSLPKGEGDSTGCEHPTPSPLGRDGEGLVGLVIVLFNPKPEEIEHLTALANTCQGYIADNSSQATFQQDMVGGMHYIWLKGNKGIAEAQNTAIAKICESHDDGYILFLDQDTQLTTDYLEQMAAEFERINATVGNLATLGPTVVDRFDNTNYSSSFHPDHPTDCGFVPRREIISSGSIVPVKVMKHVGMNDARLFIDYVDFDWCWRARAKGYVCGITPNVVIHHKVGQREISILGHKVIISAPFRYYYQMRNYLWLARRPYVPAQWKQAKGVKLIARMLYLPLIKGGSQRLKHTIRGIVAGLHQQK